MKDLFKGGAMGLLTLAANTQAYGGMVDKPLCETEGWYYCPDFAEGEIDHPYCAEVSYQPYAPEAECAGCGVCVDTCGETTAWKTNWAYDDDREIDEDSSNGYNCDQVVDYGACAWEGEDYYTFDQYTGYQTCEECGQCVHGTDDNGFGGRKLPTKNDEKLMKQHNRELRQRAQRREAMKRHLRSKKN